MSGEVEVGEVIRVDEETLKSFKFKVFLMKGSTEEEKLKAAMKVCNVGDFLIMPNGKKYKRVRGGFEEIGEDDLSMILASQI